MAIDGLAVAAVGAGSLFLYSSVKGKSVLGTLQALVKGGAPGSGPAADVIPLAPAATAGTTAAAGTVPTGSAQQALQEAAAARGWGSGEQWQALQSLEMGEASFDADNVNPTSGAYGLAQALGHGTAGTADPATGRNEYGGFGLTDAQAQAANGGNAGAQALWMVNYIADVYGTPLDAYTAWSARNPHWY